MGLRHARRFGLRSAGPQPTLFMGFEMTAGDFRVIDLRQHGGEESWRQRFLPLRDRALRFVAAGGENTDLG